MRLREERNYLKITRTTCPPHAGLDYPFCSLLLCYHASILRLGIIIFFILRCHPTLYYIISDRLHYPELTPSASNPCQGNVWDGQICSLTLKHDKYDHRSLGWLKKSDWSQMTPGEHRHGSTDCALGCTGSFGWWGWCVVGVKEWDKKWNVMFETRGQPWLIFFGAVSHRSQRGRDRAHIVAFPRKFLSSIHHLLCGIQYVTPTSDTSSCVP